MDKDTKNDMVKSYVAAFVEHGSAYYIDNLQTEVLPYTWGQHVLPLTVNNGVNGATYVCSPRTGYIDYTKEELAHFPSKILSHLLGFLIRTVGIALNFADIDRIVHINNWMVSTNLPIDIDTSLVHGETQNLLSSYPSHLLAMRSLTRRHSSKLMDALMVAGWVMVPARQIFIVDDVVKDSFKRRDTKNDARMWERKVFDYQELEQVNKEDAERIVYLYQMLYREKYSRLNPSYTAEFVMLTQVIGMIKFFVLRDPSGIIQGFGGLMQNGLHATMPLIGYNRNLEKSYGLYRLICYAGNLFTARYGLHYNMSSGVGPYKMTRGATPEIEYTAFYTRHLSFYRRTVMAIIRYIGNTVGVPLMKKHHL